MSNKPKTIAEAKWLSFSDHLLTRVKATYSEEEMNAWGGGFDAGVAFQREANAEERMAAEEMVKALEFYARCQHFDDPEDDLEPVSGEPSGLLCDSGGKFTIENGTLAWRALARWKAARK